MACLFDTLRKHFRLDEDRRPVDRLQIEGKLGKGTYGEVFACTDLTTGRALALKRIKLDLTDELTPLLFIREVAALKAVGDHPCIVSLRDVSYLDGKVSMVFELMDSDLRRYLKALPGRLPQDALRHLFWQICSAVEYCHSQRLIHRDLKPQNILVNVQTGRVKLADFGLSRFFADSREKLWTREVVTLWYRSPEILLGAKTHGPGIDLWSLGAILLELFAGRALFPGDSEITTAFKIFSILGSPAESTTASWPWHSPHFPRWSREKAPANLAAFAPRAPVCVRGLALQLLSLDPRDRLRVAQALQSDWLAGVRDVLADSFSCPGWIVVEAVIPSSCDEESSWESIHSTYLLLSFKN